MSWYLELDSLAELYVTERGNGPPVVVLHGGPGGDHEYMLGVERQLTSAYRFVFYDQRGSRRSRAPIATITLAQHVEDLETLRRALGAERIHLLSNSAGTLLAFEYLRKYRDRVGNVVLTGALPHKNGSPYYERDPEYGRLWEGLADSTKAYNDRPAVRAEINKVSSDSSLTPAKRAGLVALIRQHSSSIHRIEIWRGLEPIRVTPAAGRATRLSTNFNYDYGPDLGSHRFPMTVINGEFDYVVGPRGSPLWRRLAATSPNIEVIVIPEAAHTPWVDHPTEFARALTRALR